MRWIERTAGVDHREYDPANLLHRQVSRGAHRPYASVDAWLEAFRTRDTQFFHAFDDPAAAIRALRAHCPSRESQVLAAAERVLNREFDLLGHRGIRFPDAIDWHSDPVHEIRSPLQHWSRIPYLDASVVGDHKLIWELNRHQFLIALGQAYWYSNDERYARGFAEIIESWLAANPPKRGINWASSLEIAYRSVAWVWALHYFRTSPSLTADLFGRMLFHLELNARHIRHFLSTYFSPNTHLTGEALGLFVIGATFPEFAQSLEWQRVGWEILAEWLPKHARDDGVYIEQATYYDRYTIDILQHAWILGERNGWPARDAFAATLNRLTEHLLYISRPDGSVPVWGDEDGGCLLPLDGRPPVDARGPFGVSAALLGRSDFAFAAGTAREALIWLLGAESPAVLQRLHAVPPQTTSRAFPQGGVFVMRDGWNADASVLTIDCGPHGFANGGHAHADALAIDVTAGGHAVFVDAGTFTYTVSAAQRNRFRSSQAHNTVCVDGESSSEPGGPFTWRHAARCRLNHWHAFRRVDFFDGEHDGYARLTDPVVHRRIVLNAKGDYWLVRDVISAAAAHDVALVFQCAPDVGVRRTGAHTLEFLRNECQVMRLDIVTDGGVLSVSPELVSPQYGRLEKASCCRYALRGMGPLSLTTLLVPATRGGVATWRPQRDVSQASVTVTDAEWLDIALFPGHAATHDATVRTDAECAWVRLRAADGEPTAFLMIGGRWLEVNGRRIVDTPASLGALAGQKLGNQWHFEGEAPDAVFRAQLSGGGSASPARGAAATEES